MKAIRILCLLQAIILFAAPQAFAQSNIQQRKDYEVAVAKAVSFLRVKGQAKDGSFTKFAGIGPTAMITAGLMRNGVKASDPMVTKALAFLEKHVQKNGGIHQNGTFFRNYETCLSLMCFAEANKQLNGKYKKIIANADTYIKKLQWGEDEGKTKSDLEYGGGGYGRSKRPDMSNTSFLVDALKSAGNKADSDAMKRALVFISRCQNNESQHNTTKFSSKINDGGFYYTPVGKGSSPAGTTANGGLRSYGAMSYAGLKSMIYAGVDKKDPRVQAAVKWVKMHYKIDANPGLGQAGVYYYLHVFGKALDALKTETIVDAKGVSHAWRAELLAELKKRQRPDGSWANKNKRWLESDPNLATGFALMALSYCKPK